MDLHGAISNCIKEMFLCQTCAGDDTGLVLLVLQPQNPRNLDVSIILWLGLYLGYMSDM